MEENKDLGGRPTKYRKIFEKVAFRIALLGGTDQMLADALDVNIDTVYDWKKKYKGFSDALHRGKLPADGRAAEGLFKRAIGFYYDETTYEKFGPGDVLLAEDNELIKVDQYRKKVVVKYVIPDTTAAMRFLGNRQRELWRDRQEIDHTTMGQSMQGPLTQQQLSELISSLNENR